MSDSKKPPGQVAYEAYEKRYSANFSNHTTAPWEKLADIKKDAWHVAAVALQKELDVPAEIVHVEKDDQDPAAQDKRAWAQVCPECGDFGRPIKATGEHANAKHCARCDILFGWQSAPPQWSADGE